MNLNQYKISFNIGDILIDGVLYKKNYIKKLVVNFFCFYKRFDNQYVVLYDDKNLYTFASIIATLL